MFEPEYVYTPEQYWKIVELDPQHKYEYVDGHIRMMAGGTPAHGQIAMNIGYLFNAALLESDCNVYSSDVAVLLSEQRSYYPDVSVSCDPHDWTRKKALESPAVVVEVLSPSTKHTDRGEKLVAYRQYPAIQEILLVDSRKCYIEHHHRIGDFLWQTTIFEDYEGIITLPSIEVQISVRDIYRKVYLELEEAES